MKMQAKINTKWEKKVSNFIHYKILSRDAGSDILIMFTLYLKATPL